uniref:trehalase family glycosidase n=1 Tax=Salmonella enterica TaxID=28901 RepID=UPI00398C4205
IDAWGHLHNGDRTYILGREPANLCAFMVELLAHPEGDDALKGYLPKLQKEYANWMEGVETLQPGPQNQRVVKLEDGSVLNRYWDDRDMPRPESWVADSATAKSNPNRRATENNCALRFAAHSGWDFTPAGPVNR